ncbi:DUF4129 domain-containing protein [Paenibacillus senegalensis]|uniref:DUF4129 domain-containing protein n=1 Tax=Paenibacillus senegalensis TaxID=1465766 RepID=UPI000287AF69|nr:DUF4129 domain-containing protein [Paenibacillus senegalensis]
MSTIDNRHEDREHLQEILSRDEFMAYHQQERGPSLWERMWDLISDWFPDWSIQPEGSRSVTLIIVAVLMAVLAVVIIWLVRKMILSRTIRHKAVFLNEDDLHKSSADLLREANLAAQKGQYREAIRYRFLAILIAMDEQGWVKAEKWKTNYEYREELREQQAGAIPPFSKAARLFEQIYYGRSAAGQSQYELIKQYGEDCMRKGERDDARS